MARRSSVMRVDLNRHYLNSKMHRDLGLKTWEALTSSVPEWADDDAGGEGGGGGGGGDNGTASSGRKAVRFGETCGGTLCCLPLNEDGVPAVCGRRYGTGLLMQAGQAYRSPNTRAFEIFDFSTFYTGYAGSPTSTSEGPSLPRDDCTQLTHTHHPQT